ncbi:putative Ubiquitin-like domain-containing protein [Helianthus annuus]|nr:putative Ubiquitin-like domain-containing protein [Helianthus annuus]KAJ0826724.1 putative Ubiquitin-like domain-containing protein [Helianthus annuus]
MKVMVEIFTGKIFYVQVEDNATVLDLKKEISAQEKLPDYQRLILLFDNNVVDQNEASLVDYGIQDSSHLYLFFNTLTD